jgi:hypothetical protein
MSTRIECNRGCGAMDLHWKVVNGKYKLFSYDDLLHMCNDGKKASIEAMEKATAKILHDLDLLEPAMIPMADAISPKEQMEQMSKDLDKMKVLNQDPSKMFTISSTSNGIAITGDDKHNAIYLPKVAIPELVRALVDFIC